MMEDLKTIHDLILDAYKAVIRLSGVDLDKMSSHKLPTRHVPI